MVNNDAYVCIGKILKTHGFQKKYLVKLDIKNIKKIETIFIAIHNNYFLPFFITDFKKHNDDVYIISFDDSVELKETSLVQKDIYILAEQFEAFNKSNKNAANSFMFLKQYDLINDDKKSAKIINIIENKMQHLAEVSYNNKTILLPLHKDLIKKIDYKNKIIYTALLPDLFD